MHQRREKFQFVSLTRLTFRRRIFSPCLFLEIPFTVSGKGITKYNARGAD